MNSQLTIPAKIKQVVKEKFGSRVFSRQELINALKGKYRNINKKSILPADHCVNMKTGRWTECHFLFWVGRGKYRMYDQSHDGKWIRSEKGAVRVN